MDDLFEIFNTEDGEDGATPTLAEYQRAAIGPITKIFSQLTGATRRAGNGKLSAESRRLSEDKAEQLDRALAQHISFGLQFTSRAGDLEWSIETDSGAPLSGSDYALSRIERDGTGGGIKILKPGTSNQDGDAFTAQQVSEFFGGNEKMAAWFYDRLDNKKQQ